MLLLLLFPFYLYRDQNFGLNELAAIQDVRNEYNLQDITDEPPSSAQTTNDRGKLMILICLKKKTVLLKIVYKKKMQLVRHL